MAKKPASPLLVGTLVAVSILVLPAAVIRLVRPDALNPSEHRPTADSLKISLVLRMGSAFEQFHFYSAAVSWFQKAERAAATSPEEYASLQSARERLAGVYERTGRADEAQQAYGRMVRSSIDSAEVLMKKDQYGNAVVKFEDAEKYAQRLTGGKVEAQQNARFRAGGCYFALKRYDKAAETAARLIETQQQAGDPYDAMLAHYYEQMAFARSGMNDWPGAEEALLASIDIDDNIVRHYSEKYDPQGRDLQARQDRDLNTMQLALVYFNEKKLNLAESAAETAYQALAQRAPQDVPYQLISVGLRSAAMLDSQEQTRTWQQRMNGLCRGPNCGQ